MSEQFWWYVARASGMVAAVLLILTLIWGLLITTKLIERRGLPAWLTDLHRYLGGLSVVFIAVHLVALVFDNYLVFSWSDLFVPFASSWKAGPVAWGIGAFWGLVFVEGTSLLQRRMKRSIWRGLHFLSYPVALMTAIHAVQAGTDAGNVVFRAVSIGLIGVLSALTIFRILYSPPKRSVVPGGSGGSGAGRAAALRAAAARKAEGVPTEG
jgi:DMSO/TMAO reductase YedYZ heme-binding membrane subunit